MEAPAPPAIKGVLWLPLVSPLSLPCGLATPSLRQPATSIAAQWPGTGREAHCLPTPPPHHRTELESLDDYSSRNHCGSYYVPGTVLGILQTLPHPAYTP